MPNLICQHFYVSGKVQGVWFRASTKEQADQLNITGWVKNLPDGRVEVLAVGEEKVVHQLHQWLLQGPPRAEVADLTVESLPWQQHSHFLVL